MTPTQRSFLIALTAFATLAVGQPSQAETIGEGYSATTEQPAQYGYRAFTVPDFPRICRDAPPAARIEFAKTRMTLQVGDSFSLADLPSATAFDDDGAVAESVPLNIVRTSGHHLLEPDWSAKNKKWLVVAPGEVQITVDGACRRHEKLRASLTIVIPSPASNETSTTPAITETSRQ